MEQEITNCRPLDVGPIVTNSQLNYIEKYWEEIAAFAWARYWFKGRGVLVFEPRPLGSFPLSKEESLPLSEEDPGYWVCRYEPWENMEDNPMEPIFSDIFCSYDPEKQIIAVFLTPPNQVHTYCGPLNTDRVTPPEAYEAIVGPRLDSVKTSILISDAPSKNR
jgi:hypothetical protein